MKLQLLSKIDTAFFPSDFKAIMQNADIYDSSSSSQAKTFFIDKQDGFYLKCSDKTTLLNESKMAEYFYKKGLGVEVVQYVSADKDWMLTKKASGQDCIAKQYLAEPKKLCDKVAELLQILHCANFKDCPNDNITAQYINMVEQNYSDKKYDFITHNEDNWGFVSAEEAINFFRANKQYLKHDTLIHGDYCLPNIILDNWKFSAFIDVGNGGVGDKHVDLFWGAWSLYFNLKTDKYSDRFFDAYGRQHFDKEMLRVVASAEVFN